MSYTLATTTVPRSNSNAEFQAWGSQISYAIANCGIVKESDANVGTQINWGTVAAPNASNQSRGYEIYKFNDAAQATTPIYFKIEYGSGGSNTTPAIWLTWGSGANGSGNVTGNTTTRQQIISTAGGTARASYYAGANNRLIFSFCAGGTVQEHMLVGMERTLDSNGAVTTDGLAIIMAYTTNKFQALWTPTTANVTAWESTYAILTPSSTQNTGLYRGLPGEFLTWYPWYVNQGAKWYPYQTIVVAYFNGEMTTGIPSTVLIYGANSTYLPLGNTCLYPAAYRGGNKTALAIRWE
jgi:hypothetical protein